MDKNTRREAYLAKLRDPRWQRRRLEILNRDEFTCQSCFDTESTLHVHHRYYVKDSEPWEYPDHFLITLCISCHEFETENAYNVQRELVERFKCAGFLVTDLMYVSAGLLTAVGRENERMLAHAPYVVAATLQWFFADFEAQHRIISEYLDTLHSSGKDESNDKEA